MRKSMRGQEEKRGKRWREDGGEGRNGERNEGGERKPHLSLTKRVEEKGRTIKTHERKLLYLSSL